MVLGKIAGHLWVCSHGKGKIAVGSGPASTGSWKVWVLLDPHHLFRDQVDEGKAVDVAHLDLS